MATQWSRCHLLISLLFSTDFRGCRVSGLCILFHCLSAALGFEGRALQAQGMVHSSPLPPLPGLQLPLRSHLTLRLITVFVIVLCAVETVPRVGMKRRGNGEVEVPAHGHGWQEEEWRPRRLSTALQKPVLTSTGNNSLLRALCQALC